MENPFAEMSRRNLILVLLVFSVGICCGPLALLPAPGASSTEPQGDYAAFGPSFLMLYAAPILIFAVLYSRRVRSVKGFAVITLSVLALMTLGFSILYKNDGYDLSNAFLLNVGTEFVGVALLVILFSLGRWSLLALVITYALALALLAFSTEGWRQDTLINLNTELFGVFITSLIFAVIDRNVRERQQKQKSA